MIESHVCGQNAMRRDLLAKIKLIHLHYRQYRKFGSNKTVLSASSSYLIHKLIITKGNHIFLIKIIFNKLIN
jgi:hypothetical protein